MNKRKIKTTKIVLIILAIFIVAFTCTCLWMFYHDKQVPDSLITCVFGLCGTECGVMGWIKSMKTKYVNDVTSNMNSIGLDTDFTEVNINDN